MVAAVSHISGGHFNPAITLALLVTRRIAVPLAGFYVLVQLGGAAAAALLLRWVLPKEVSQLHQGAPLISSTIDASKAVTIEAVLTFFLVWVVFATALDPRRRFKQISPLAIGFTIVVGVAMAYALTGAEMNPARAFGPELVSAHWKNSGSGTSARWQEASSPGCCTSCSTWAGRRARASRAPLLTHPP